MTQLVFIMFLVLILIIIGIIIISIYLKIRKKIRNLSQQIYGVDDIIKGIKKQEELYENTPKSISAMTRIYLPHISKDFPYFNWDDYKSKTESLIMAYLNSLETKSGIDLDYVSLSLKNKVDNGWHQIETQLQRRYDLIPNLIETVKGYAAHEKEVFENITAQRAQVVSASTVAQKAQAESGVTSALKTLFAVAENYPDLKASQNFTELQVELSNTENKIAFARQFYNDTVTQFNTAIDVFPKNIIAKALGFTKREYFEVDEPEVRKAPTVKF